MRVVAVALLCLVALVRPAGADALGDVAGRGEAVRKLEADRAQLDGRRVRLEHENEELAGDIEHWKAQSAGVRRDFRLSELLAAAKSKSDELERVAAELRWRGSALVEGRRQLIAACDRALAGQLPEARRLELARLRTSQTTLLTMPSVTASGKVAPVVVDPLDGPRELAEKADLLRDSEDKLKREVQRLASRIDDVERRRHLRERVGAVDEDWFGEATSNRKFARVTSTPAMPADKTVGGTTGGAGSGRMSGFGATDTNQAPAAAAPPAGGATTPTVGGAPTPGGGSVGSTPGTQPPPTGGGEFGGGGARASDTTVLRNLVDPSTLDELRRADGGDDLERQLRALRRAQGELQSMANDLERRARSLSTRADELKRKK
jgi:hypothetical protein